MGHPDQYTPDDHRTSNRDAAPEPNVSEDIKEDLDPEARRELEERADTGSEVRAEEPEGKRIAETGGQYVGRGMDDALKSEPRPDGDGIVDE